MQLHLLRQARCPPCAQRIRQPILHRRFHLNAPPKLHHLRGRYRVVTWTSEFQDGIDYGVYQQAYNADGTTRGTETQVNTETSGNQDRQQVTALANGGWVVSWVSQYQDGSQDGVYQQAYNADGSTLGAETRVNTHVDQLQNNPIMTALADGGWVVTWNSYAQDGSGWGTFQQRYGADGEAVGVETQVNTFPGADQSGQQIIALSDGGWVVAWSSYYPVDHGIYQQRFDAEGEPVGTETRVSELSPAGYQNDIQLAERPGGGWVVLWTTYDRYGTLYDIDQQVFDSDGVKVGNETRVNTYQPSSQYEPKIAVLSDGGWVVTWLSVDQDGSGSGIYQQAYDADGTANGVETLVNTETVGNQFGPMITALSDGGWVVVWSSDGQDGSRFGVYQQAYNADGSANGGETQVNEYTLGNQYLPEVKALPNGAWVVVWRSDIQDGWSSGVSQRTFWLNDAPTVDNTIADRQTDEDDAFSFTFAADTFGDANQLDTLTYCATLADGSDLPEWLTFDAATRTFSGTPENDDVGEITIRLTARDGNGEEVSTEFTLEVENVNDRPTLPSGRRESTFENRALTIDVLADAEDVDGDTVGLVSASVRSGFGSVVIRNGKLVYDPTTSANQDIPDGGSRAVVIRYTVSDGNGGTATTDLTITVKGISPDIFKGTAGSDRLTGSAHGDVLHGYAGGDTLNGGTGADRMIGDTGSDTYVVDNARDTVIEQKNEGQDHVRASVSQTLAAHVEDLTLIGTRAIDGTGNGLANEITGNGAANTLEGEAGNDRIAGGGGNDRIVGGQGADHLSGNGGAEIFIFTAIRETTVGASGRDTILDFSRSQDDRISLRAIDADTKAAGNQAFTFIGKDAFSRDAGELRFEVKKGDTVVLGDINGDGRADFSILLDKAVNLNASDFLL